MSDLEIAGDEDEVIEQIDEEIARTTNPRARRVLRICKALLPALTRALQDERDLGIEPQEVPALVSMITQSALHTLASNVTLGHDRQALLLCKMVLVDINHAVDRDLRRAMSH